MPQVAPSPPIARIHGEPLLVVPEDLYIPPDALEVFLETFEGPLDLLLYLIRRHNLDVLDIQMAKLTAQYLEYVEMMRANQLELAAEYLLMAAVLIEIKSRMLLPKPRVTDEDSEDPRAELVRRLLEYEKMKLAAQKLHELPQAGRDFQLVQVWIEHAAAVRLPEVRPEDLREAWLSIIARAKVTQHHRISREQLSVRERMTRVLRQLRDNKFVAFEALFDPALGVAEMVVTFLAILELAREGLIDLTQQAAFSPIYVRPNGSELEAA
ncbi:MAG: segregation/condensation protein A [Burkholderiales bacterium]|nr:segregation/condensation protein A [Burkholderiales bacterium]